MAQPLALVLNVPEALGDQDQEPSPYEESEVHDSFHQLIQQQSQLAEEELELQQRQLVAGTLGVPGSGHQTLLGPEGAPVHSAATLRILASMPSRTIGRSRGAIISQYYNRTVKLRRRGSRPLLGDLVRSARPSLRLYDLELGPRALEEDGEGALQSPVSAGQEARLLALPLVVSLLNLGASYLFRGLAALERHESPGLEVYVSICRNLILKMAILGILCYHWLGRRVAALQGQCWEDFVGQELYRFMVMDFLFALLDTLFGELVWRLISERKLKRRRKPEFDIARNVLDLIYGQTLTWLGVLFAPLLPAVQVLRLLLLFLVKKASLMANCQAPRRPWLASHMSTVFLTLLCFPSFLGAAIFLCYAVWQVKPSSTCGPFRTLDTMYEAGRVWVRHLESAGPRASWVPWLHRYLVESTFFLFLASALLLAIIYFNIQVVKGQRKVISLLKEQIRNEGEDKIFLINRLHSVYERKERSRAHRNEEAVTPSALLADGGDSWWDSEGPCRLPQHPQLRSVTTSWQAETRI
ncbi:transmembrane channel-like protein 6 [Marmota marmota marmota]|uniref:transmembrane channel-like protein 6 n=1 Tax=Marmota marmota marmota TaxID=9994 RepID=UPI0020933E9D|nr:transmembrane channel-like protein 6 [Marmota marmota marmota]